MKVTTDACIQGAWTPVLPHVRKVLDIGAGTGLLALMLAQRCSEIKIDAIEIDTDAAQQAQENILASPWHGRIRLIAGDVRAYPWTGLYDLIIVNPPFFANSLLSNDAAKDLARHTIQLSYSDLLHTLLARLAGSGYVSLILPAGEYRVWADQAAAAGLFESFRLSVCHTQDAPVKRCIGLFSKDEPTFTGAEKLVIKDAGDRYTPAFTSLLAPFYLGLQSAVRR